MLLREFEILFQAGLDTASFNFEMTAKKLEEDRNRMKKENEQIVNDEVEKMKVLISIMNFFPQSRWILCESCRCLGEPYHVVYGILGYIWELQGSMLWSSGYELRLKTYLLFNVKKPGVRIPVGAMCTADSTLERTRRAYRVKARPSPTHKTKEARVSHIKQVSQLD